MHYQICYYEKVFGGLPLSVRQGHLRTIAYLIGVEGSDAARTIVRAQNRTAMAKARRPSVTGDCVSTYYLSRRVIMHRAPDDLRHCENKP
ncbi:MAG: hypothetical protein AAF098_10895 [Pseudomonadota bacterium]